jgi:DNA polymerase III epsilon subunit-like protein
MSDAIVFDTETTGLTLPGVADLDKQPRIIELGAVRISGGKRVAELSQLLQPSIVLEDACKNHQTSAAGDCVQRGALCYKKIATINDINKEMLADKPTFKEFMPQLAEFFKGAVYLIAHNCPFDLALLQYDLARCGALEAFPIPPNKICTAQEFTYMFGKRPRLIQLYEKVMGVPLAQKHRALDDVNAMVEVLDKVNFWETLNG